MAKEGWWGRAGREGGSEKGRKVRERGSEFERKAVVRWWGGVWVGGVSGQKWRSGGMVRWCRPQLVQTPADLPGGRSYISSACSDGRGGILRYTTSLLHRKVYLSPHHPVMASSQHRVVASSRRGVVAGTAALKASCGASTEQRTL